MGVKRLTKFVNQEQDKLLTDHKLHDTRLIVDGNNLVYQLWSYFAVEQQYGGDYDVFAKKCRVFFGILKTCHVEAYVVFDGGDAQDDRKLKTKLERRQKRIVTVNTLCKTCKGTVVPILAKDTFVHVLVELNVAHVCCDFEADREIAVLANKFNCPVMSVDSDFYIFELTAGFIPFNYVELKTDIKIHVDGSGFSEYVPVKLYKTTNFAKHYKIRPEILPLFGCILGNDYIDVAQLRGFYFEKNLNLVEKEPEKFKKKIKKILKTFRRQPGVNECLQKILAYVPEQDREVTEKLIKIALGNYSNLTQFDGTDLVKVLEENRAGQNDTPHVEVLYSRFQENVTPLPMWFRRAQQRCQLSPTLQNVALLGKVYQVCQVEDLSMTTSHDCSRRIREVTYAVILGQGTKQRVEEYDRYEKKIQCFAVKPRTCSEQFQVLPNVETIPYHKKEDMVSLLFYSIELSTRLRHEDISNFFKFLLGLVIWWKRHSQSVVNKTHCYCLIFGVITLHTRLLKQTGISVLQRFPREIRDALTSSSDDQIRHLQSKTEKYFQSPQEFKEHKKDVRILHAFAMFQSCLKDTIELNELLMMPVEPPNPSLILNSSFAYNLYRRLQFEANPEIVLTDMLGAGSPMYIMFNTLIDYGRLRYKYSKTSLK